MRQKILILGASKYQVPSIIVAKNMGLTVYVADNVPSNPGHCLADKSFGISTTNKAAILQLSRDLGIDAISCPCSDVAVPTVAYVAKNLGLVGPDDESTEIFCSKINFRNFQKNANFPHPQFFFATEARPNGHFLVKPDKSSGSKGVYHIPTEAANVVLDASAQFSLNKKIIVEEFIVGSQGTCEGFLKNGKVAFHFCFDKITAPQPYCTTAGHSYPSKIATASLNQLVQDIEVIFKMLNISTTFFDVDFVVGKNNIPYIIEMTPRLGGNSLSTLVSEVSGIDIVRLNIEYCLGKEIHITQWNSNPTTLMILGSFENRQLQFDTLKLSQVSHKHLDIDLQLDFPPGQEVHIFSDGRHRYGQVLVRGKALPEALKTIEKILGEVQVLPLPFYLKSQAHFLNPEIER